MPVGAGSFLASAAPEIAGSLFGGGGSPLGKSASASSNFADRSVINIAPGDTNAGEILRMFTGSPENGGNGASDYSRYMGAGFNPDPDAAEFDSGGAEPFPWLLAAGAVATAVLSAIIVFR